MFTGVLLITAKKQTKESTLQLMNDDIMGKQNMAQLYRGILIGNKKEYSNDTCCNADEKGKK